MSNKTSDENVANEERLNNFIEAYKQTKEQSFIVDSINKDFFFEFVDCLLAEREQDKKYIKNLEIALKIINKVTDIDETKEENIALLKEILRKLEDISYGRG